MEQFIAIGCTKAGRRRRAIVPARNIVDAGFRLRRRGLFVIRIAQARGRTRAFYNLRMDLKSKVYLFRQLELLISSGVLVHDALDRLRDRFPDAKGRAVISEIHDQVANSRKPLSLAFALFPRSFPERVTSLIKAGEEAGSKTLAERFGDLAEYLSEQGERRWQMAKSLAYPVFLVALTACVDVFFTVVVFPRLESLLGSVGADLPPFSKRVIALSHGVQAEWPMAAAAVVVLVCAVSALRLSQRVAFLLDRGVLAIPLFGAIYKENAAALFCSVYRSLYRAGRPAPEILNSCASVVANRAFAQAIREIRHKVSVGAVPLSKAIDASGLFSPMAGVCIEVGEASGRLDASLQAVGKSAADRAHRLSESLLAALNPAVLLAAIAFPAAMLFGFFQAYFKLAQAIR
jgi:type II secretory pathway component PulF